MNVKIDVNLSELGQLFKASSDGKLYLCVDDLVNKYGYVSEKKKEYHFTLTAYDRREKSQYGTTHNVKMYDKNLRQSFYCNAVDIKEYVQTLDGQQPAAPAQGPNPDANVARANGSIYPEDLDEIF